jgi:putative addiction module component (TIGR02574 family)
MSEAAEKPKPLLAALTREDRAELVEYLTTLDNGAHEPAEDEQELTRAEWEAAWIPEIERRIADFENGKTVGIPAEEVMRRMKEKYG